MHSCHRRCGLLDSPRGPMHLGLELCSIQCAATSITLKTLLTESTLHIFVSSKNWLIPESNVSSTDFSSRSVFRLYAKYYWVWRLAGCRPYPSLLISGHNNFFFPKHRQPFKAPTSDCSPFCSHFPYSLKSDTNISVSFFFNIVQHCCFV